MKAVTLKCYSGIVLAHENNQWKTIMKCEKKGALAITEIKLLNVSIFLETEAQDRDIQRFNQDHVAFHGKSEPNTNVVISRQPTTQESSRTEISFLVCFFFSYSTQDSPHSKWVKCDPKHWLLSFGGF